jgi:Tetratricopeptide repeat.
LDSTYLKAYYRRAQLYEGAEKLDEALEDYKKILELDPLHREALYASKVIEKSYFRLIHQWFLF